MTYSRPLKDHKVVNKFGRNIDIDASTTADLWDNGQVGGTLIWVAPTQARVHAVVSTDATDTVGTGTLTLTGQPLDTETVTIAAKVYTFQTVLTEVDGNVLIGATASDSIDNLIAAINLGAGAGTNYATATTANAVDTTAAAGAGDTMSLYDNSSGSIATTETLTNGSWGASTITPGTGARTVQIDGLTSWTADEVSETVDLKGVDAVNTINSYVIIHRMKVTSSGSTSINAGAITATAATDSTVTAKIRIAKGQTQMAIYGIPTGKTLDIQKMTYSLNKSSGGAAVGYADFKIMYNENPTTELTRFITKESHGLSLDGTSALHIQYPLGRQFVGPGIIKVQCDSGTNTLDVAAEFNAALIDS